MIARQIRLFLGFERDYEFILPYSLEESVELFRAVPQTYREVWKAPRSYRDMWHESWTLLRDVSKSKAGGYRFSMMTHKYYVFSGELYDNGHNSTLARASLNLHWNGYAWLIYSGFWICVFLISNLRIIFFPVVFIGWVMMVNNIREGCNDISSTMDTILMLEHKK